MYIPSGGGWGTHLLGPILPQVIPCDEHVYTLQAATAAPSPVEAAKSWACSIAQGRTMGNSIVALTATAADFVVGLLILAEHCRSR